MTRAQKPRSGIAMGGLGCGWFELRQDGQFYNWRIFNNRPIAQGSYFLENSQSALFFVIRYQIEGETPRLCLLQIEESHGVAGLEEHEFQYIFPWLSGVDAIHYEASFPFADLKYSAADMPLEVTMRAWSPFIPRNAKDSALPAAFFDFSIRSTCGKPVDVLLLSSMRNWVGYDEPDKTWKNRIVDAPWGRTCEMSCDGMDRTRESCGSMGLSSLHPESRYYCGWGHPHPYYERLLRQPDLPDLDDTGARNAIDPKTGKLRAIHNCFNSIGRAFRLEKRGQKADHTFLATWDFPNRHAIPARCPGIGPAGYLEADASRAAAQPDGAESALIEGHYYSNFFGSAAEVARYCAEEIARLRDESRLFHDTFFASTLPGFALDQINSHLNTFRTSSWFTSRGDFGLLEGLGPTRAYAGLSTMDVAMYGGIATASLFPELERAIIRSHVRFQNDDGSVVHSIRQNFQVKSPSEASGLRLDMPAQHAYMALRAGLWADDAEFLAEVWPSVVKALEYGLARRDKNGDGLPDMEGIMCSYDNFPMYGVAPYVATQWLAAYAAAAAAAPLVGDEASARRYRSVLQQASRVVEDHAWNGSYYDLYVDGDKSDPGCMTDQIIGHWAALLLNLPGFLKPERVRSSLQAILRHNYAPDQGLRNCQWPGDTFLHDVPEDCWVDQANTCWSGVELAFASLLIYEGMTAEGLDIVRNIDERYRRWGIYWDHQEFGGHYFRPMSAWAIIPAALGFTLVNGVMTVAPRITDASGDCRLFFTTSESYGLFRRTGESASIEVVSGVLKLRSLRLLANPADARDGEHRVLAAGSEELRGTLKDGYLCFDSSRELHIPAGETLALMSRAPLSRELLPV